MGSRYLWDGGVGRIYKDGLSRLLACLVANEIENESIQDLERDWILYFTLLICQDLFFEGHIFSHLFICCNKHKYVHYNNFFRHIIDLNI